MPIQLRRVAITLQRNSRSTSCHRAEMRRGRRARWDKRRHTKVPTPRSQTESKSAAEPEKSSRAIGFHCPGESFVDEEFWSMQFESNGGSLAEFLEPDVCDAYICRARGRGLWQADYQTLRI